MQQQGPEVYAVNPIATRLEENEDFDKFIRKLCDEIEEAAKKRKDLFEDQWRHNEEVYWGTGGGNGQNRTESDLDFTVSFEICKHASANLTTPIMAQDTFYSAKARPGFPTIAATHDTFLDWMMDRWDFVSFIPDLIRHSQIYHKAVFKSPWRRDVRKIKYWTPGEGGELSEVEEEHVVFEGSKAHIVNPWNIYHPIPTPSVDEATWWAEEFETTRAEIRSKKKAGYYRADLEIATIGDDRFDPDEREQNQELWAANALEALESEQTDYEKLRLMEVYTTYEGAECVIVLDRLSRTWLAAHGPFYQDFPRCYGTFSWHDVVGSVDGKPLCGVLSSLHDAYVSIMNLLLDAGLRSIEPLVLAVKELGLGEMFRNGQLASGLVEVKKKVIANIKEGIHVIELTSGDLRFLLSLLERIEKHMHDAASIPPAFFGEELANRPTAMGTTSVLEKAMQPLYELMTRFRLPLIRLAEIEYSQYRQFHPESVRIFIEAQPPEDARMMDAMLVEFPPGYWRDQVLIETKVNSQTMSKAIKKQEALAFVDKWPQITNNLLQVGEAAVSGGPISPLAGNLVDVQDQILKIFLTEFEMPEVRDALDIKGVVMAGNAVAEAQQKLVSIIEQVTAENTNIRAQYVDATGEEPEGLPPQRQPGGAGPSEAAA